MGEHSADPVGRYVAGEEDSFVFAALNALACSGPQTHSDLFWYSGANLVDFVYWFTSPRKDFSNICRCRCISDCFHFAFSRLQALVTNLVAKVLVA